MSLVKLAGIHAQEVGEDGRVVILFDASLVQDPASMTMGSSMKGMAGTNGSGRDLRRSPLPSSACDEVVLEVAMVKSLGTMKDKQVGSRSVTGQQPSDLPRLITCNLGWKCYILGISPPD